MILKQLQKDSISSSNIQFHIFNVEIWLYGGLLATGRVQYEQAIYDMKELKF